jgi:N-hydroxyarylamine O-acetyltransferase
MAAPAESPQLAPSLVAAYLRRLGLDERPAATAEVLRNLHRAHLERVPFENLDIQLGIPIELDAHRFAEQIAVGGRGGFCYQLNGAFALLLDALGFAVELLEARVHSPSGLGGPFGHLCLRVRLDGRPYLVDVGFGRGSFDEPIALVAEIEQVDSAGLFVLCPAEGGALDMRCDGTEEYRVALAARVLEDFEPGCRYHQTSPESAFTRASVCSIRTPEGRTTLSGTRLVETTLAGREERELDRAELGDVLVRRFGIALPDAALDRLAAQRTRP